MFLGKIPLMIQKATFMMIRMDNPHCPINVRWQTKMSLGNSPKHLTGSEERSERGAKRARNEAGEERSESGWKC